MIEKFYRVAVLWYLLLTSGAIYPQQPVWEKLNTPVDVTLKYLSFTDSLNGWVAGESGTIIHTSDGGSSWQIQNSTVSTFIVDIFFVDENHGWALTSKDVFPFNTIILKTTNGGSDWTAENFQDTSALMRTIFFHDTLNGFIGGSYIAHTSDGGNSWIKAAVDSNLVSNYPVYNFSFHSRQFGYACGGVLDNAGVIWKTTDYGYNWTAEGVSADQVFDLEILDSLNAITLSGDPEGFFATRVVKTTNAGTTWNFEDLPFSHLSFSIDFRTPNEGWSASGFRFLFTSDRGDTWNELAAPDSSIVFNLQFTDARTGYASGVNGTILKFSLPPDTMITPPDNFELYQNFPNPFNSVTNIRFKIPEPAFTTMKVYNILGKEVATIINEEKTADEYECVYSATPGLASGIYFYQLRAGEFLETKKMIYLK